MQIGSGFRVSFDHRHGVDALFGAAEYLDGDPFTDAPLIDVDGELAAVLHHFAVEAQHDIARLQASCSCGPRLCDVNGEDDAPFLRKAESARHQRCYRLSRNANLAAMNASGGLHVSLTTRQELPGTCRPFSRGRVAEHDVALVAHIGADLLENVSHDVGRRRETQPLVPAGLRQDERVDAYDVAGSIDERAAAITRIDRRVRLDINHRVLGLELPCDSAHDAHRDGVLEAKGTPECKHDLAGTKPIRIAELEKRQVALVRLENGDVRFEIHANDLRTDEAPAPPETKTEPPALGI